MSLFDTNRGRWLFCMTHPDDEISICAWIKRLTDAGSEVFLSWTHSNDVREKEARAVAKMLGVPQENLTFFGATDGRVCTQIGELLPQFRQLMSDVQPDVVACGAFEQGHLDHDATNFLVNRSFGGDVLEIPFYHTYLTKLQTMNTFSDPSGQEQMTLSREEAKFKRAVAKQFKSQNIWKVLFWYEIWKLSQGDEVELSTREVMRLQTHTHFGAPNHPIAIASEVEASDTWKWWLECIKPYV